MQYNEHKPLTMEQVSHLQEWAKQQRAKRQRETLCKSCEYCKGK